MLKNRPSTLQLAGPFGQSFILALVIFIGIIILIEAVLRVPAVGSQLPVHSLGSNHVQFEVQLVYLQRFAHDGPVDCLFVGSSMVRRGIDPTIIEQVYAEQTGDTIRCYAFGVNGATASVVDALLAYLVETYQPRLIVYGISPRDFEFLDNSALDIPRLDWLSYVNGSFNVSGWLMDHSKLVQYAPFVSTWISNDPRGRIALRERLSTQTLANGHSPSDRELAMLDLEREMARIEDLYGDYTMLQTEEQALQHILTYHHPPDTQLLLLEFPVYPAIIPRLMSEQTYLVFNEEIFNRVQVKRILYWPTTQLHLIPDAGWADLNHLNREGAAVFSTWVGQQIAAAVNSGELQPIMRAAD